jgi:streptomycin 6-kinase
VLVNQDLHAGNVLSAHREPWLVIDPKPLVGEREFGVSALIRGRELGASREALLHRLDRLTEVLGLDRDRARRWSLAQTLAWAFDQDAASATHVETAHWLMEAGEEPTTGRQAT